MDEINNLLSDWINSYKRLVRNYLNELNTLTIRQIFIQFDERNTDFNFDNRDGLLTIYLAEDFFYNKIIGIRNSQSNEDEYKRLLIECLNNNTSRIVGVDAINRSLIKSLNEL